MGTAIKHPMPGQVKPSFVIFDIRALWRSGLTNLHAKFYRDSSHKQTHTNQEIIHYNEDAGDNKCDSNKCSYYDNDTCFMIFTYCLNYSSMSKSLKAFASGIIAYISYTKADNSSPTKLKGK